MTPKAASHPVTGDTPELAHSQKLEALGQFAAGIAHDFNNLLTAVTGAADLVLGREGVDPETRDDVTQIRRCAERGIALVSRLRSFGCPDASDPRVIAVDAAIGDLARLLERVLGGNVGLRLELDAGEAAVRMDPTQLDRVLMNLAVNARDAMPGGGTLTFRTAQVELHGPETHGGSTIPPGRYLLLEVADTGSGIPPEVLPRIFDPFFTTKGETGGSGLGLSTVRDIVGEADGFLAVESVTGRGTSFRIHLPHWMGSEEPASVAEASVPDRPSAEAPMQISGASGTVLLVEDEEPVRRLAERALSLRGWRVLAAGSAGAAWSALDALGQEGGLAGLSVIISDVAMPGMDGTALVKAVRARHPGVPAILVSGYAEETFRPHLGLEGISFIPKPYTLKDLVAEVAKVTEPAVRQGCGPEGEP